MEWSTVRRNVEYAAWAHGVADADIAQRADESLERVGLLDRRGSRARSLSGGMRPRLIKASSSTAPFRRRTSLDGHLSRLDARPEPQPRHGLARAVHRSHVCRVVGVIQRPMGNLRTPPLPPDVRAAPDPRRNRSPVRHAAPDRLDRPAGSQTGRELRRLRGRHRMRHGGAVARLHPVADQPVAGLRHLPARRHTHERSDDARPVRAHHPLLGIQRERRRRAGPGLPRHRPDRQNARTRDRHPLPVAAPFKAKTSSSSCPETTSALPSFPYPRGQE